MKKIISVVLAVVMMLSIMSVTAYAANNGPKEPGANDFMGFYSTISLIETDGEGHTKTVKNEEYGYEEEVATYILSEDGVKNLDGISYDKSTNTLTLTNFKAEDKVLSYCAMGDDFKIKVVGNCSLGQIRAAAYYWSSAVTFTGTGTLTVNKDKLFMFGFNNSSYGADSAITFDKGVNVKISGADKAIAVTNSKAKSADKVFVFNGSCKASVSSEQQYQDRSLRADGYSIDKTPKPDYIGPKAKCLTDPDGIYVMGTSTTTDSSGNKKVGHWVNKLVYSKAFGLYVLAPFANGSVYKYVYPGDEDYNDYVEDEGTLYNTEKRYVSTTLRKKLDKNGKVYVYGTVWDSSEQSVVATYSEIPDVKGAYYFTAVKEGEEADKFAETLSAAPEELVPIGKGVYTDATYVTGIFVKELEMGRDHLGAPVKSKDDPKGIYFMTHGTRYENWGEENEKQIPSRWIKKYVYVEKYDVYIIDERFADYGTLEMDFDDFDTSGYTLVNGDSDSGHVYNNGEIKHVYGQFYKDKNGKKYVVDTVYDDDGKSTKIAYDYEEIKELSTDSEKKYICIPPAESVDVDSLTEMFEREYLEDQTNYYIDDKDLVFNGGESITDPTNPTDPTDPENIGDSSDTQTVKKKANTMTVKVNAKTVKLKDVKKKKVTVKNAITVKKNQGAVSYAAVKKGTSKGVSISKKGVITIKKGAAKKKTTLKIVVNVTAKGNKNYKKLTKKVTVKIKVK